MNGTAAVEFRRGPGESVVALTGALDARSLPPIWPGARAAVIENGAAPLRVDAAGVTYCDGSGIAFLLDLLREGSRHGSRITITNLAPRFAELLGQFDGANLDDEVAPTRAPRLRMTEQLGRALLQLAADLRRQGKYVRRVTVCLFYELRHPLRVRWKEVVGVAEQMGVNGLPVVTLIAFLMGVILAYQSAVPMRQFGAQIFVANLIGLSLLRELAPLMTAIVLAGRTGAAFAAEIGTMKVNEEIDALTTMALDPVRFLVVPRLIATLSVTPLLTIYAGVVGLIGGGLVMITFDIPLVTYFRQIVSVVSIGDFTGGLFKSAVFAYLVVAVGCLRGLETQGGPRAVGQAATRAVVSGIVLIVVFDGIFAVIFNLLGI
ncbi:MAG TPA: MlaE family lipid ABC transporter permease subunit [Burkholderiaceae bacterium]|jgi:phospholipid/cholesterol/gamma-HCH transport system permease protein|nr:MlaE family lipid ABC transporter permease subunit [Burkholderiaceae bacterium]